MKPDPISGPIPRDEFKAMAELPYGEACKAIRKYDPLFGLKPGDKIDWEIVFSRTAYEEGYATVQAETEKEAVEIASELPDHKISWSAEDCDNSVVESARPKR